MNEPPQLRAARDHLARAEIAYRSQDGLLHLEEGLALLDEIIASGNAAHCATAENLAATYAAKLCRSISQLVQADPGLPEPDLEHLFKVLLAFDHGDFQLPAQARRIKVGIARRLVDRYYEGHAPEQKQQALEQLTQIAGGDRRKASRTARRTRKR